MIKILDKCNNKIINEICELGGHVHQHYIYDYSWVAEEINKVKDEKLKLADLGCGEGNLALYLSKSYDVTGFDQNINPLLQTYKQTLYYYDILKEHTELNYKFKQLNLTDEISLSKYRDYFDILYSVSSLEHNSENDLDRILKQCHIIAKKNSLFFITIPVLKDLPKNIQCSFILFDESKIKSFFQRHGWKLLNNESNFCDYDAIRKVYPFEHFYLPAGVILVKEN